MIVKCAIEATSLGHIAGDAVLDLRRRETYVIMSIHSSGELECLILLTYD